MSAEAPLFSIIDDRIVLSTQPPASVRVELNGRQLADGQELKLQNKSVIEVRYAEVVNRHCDPYKRWMVLFSAQYLHGSLGGRGTQASNAESHQGLGEHSHDEWGPASRRKRDFQTFRM